MKIRVADIPLSSQPGADLDKNRSNNAIIHLSQIGIQMLKTFGKTLKVLK